MAPTEPSNQTLNTNTPETEPQHKSWWPLWLLGGLILLFLLMIIILRSLCTDVWYINLLKLNDNLCNGQSSLQQNVSLKDGSIRGPEIAEGAIGLDNLSPSLQVSINNINNQLINPVPGPQGTAGFNGSTGPKGSTGATGLTGPAGPTDPCVISGTYFCQNGNTYGTLAVLGTNDAQDLQVVTGGLENTKFDVNGNLTLNRSEAYTGFAPTYDALTYGNVFINQDQSFNSTITSTGTGLFGGTNSNFLAVSDSTLNDVGGSTGIISNSVVTGSLLNGSIVNSNINGLVGLTGGFWGGSVTSSFGLNGLFLTTQVTNSNYIMGNFQEGICIPIFGPCPPPVANIITSSNNILGMTDSTSILSSDRLLISGRNSSITSSNDSLVSLNTSTLNDSDRSLVFLENSVGDNISKSVVNVDLFSSVSNTGISFIAGSLIDFDNVFNSSVTGFDSTANGLGAFYGNLSSSNVTTLQGGSAFLNQSTINNVFGLYGFTGWATVADTVYAAGKFEGVDVADSSTLIGQFGYFSCDPTLGCALPNVFEIHNSSAIVGEAIYTDIYDSSGLSLYTNSTDPTIFNSVITNVHTSSIAGYDVSITDSHHISSIGNSNTVSDTTYSQILGDTNTISGLDHSILVGDGVALADPGVGSYDYSFLGADSTGSINTRINHKGDDSWLNANGGNVGIGTATPTSTAASANLEVAGNIRVDGIGGGPSASSVCVNGTNDLVLCSSSARYKENVKDLSLGLETLMQLKAVSYDWKEDGTHDLGFIAEDTAAINTLLTTYNKSGEIQGVKYDKLTAVITKAVQEQEGKIEGINIQLASQGLRLDSLTEDLKALAGRVDNLQKEFDQYKLNTEVRIKILEDKLNSQVAAPATLVTP